MTRSDEPDHATSARTIGRGVVVLTAAKGWFVLSGMTLLFLLPRLGGGTEVERAALFGTYSVVLAILNPLTMMVVSGALQATSKFISENPARYAHVVGKALRLQSILGLVLGVGLVLAAPLLAKLLSDDTLVSPLRHAAPILFLYAMYAVFIGGFNGTRRFVAQGLMDILFATVKIALILGAVALGFGVVGAVSGFALTALLLTLLAGGVSWRLAKQSLTGEAKPEEHVTAGDLWRFEVWIMAYALVLNLLMNADLYMVKAFTQDPAVVGVYSAALQVARLPYVAVVSVTFVLFPLVSRATYAEDLPLARRTIERALRGSLRVVGPLALVLAACGADVLRLVFPPLYVQGAWQLSALSVGYFFFALLAILGTVFSGAGRPWISMLLVTITLALSLTFSWVGMRTFGPNGAAMGMALALSMGTLLAGILLLRRFHPRLPLATLAKVLLAGVFVFLASQAWLPEAKPWIMVKGAGVTVLYLALLVVLRELTLDDWHWVRDKLRKGR